MKGCFLLEIGTEEIPASYLEPALEQLTGSVEKLLKSNQMEFGAVITALTPRRSTLFIQDVELKQEDKEVTFTGPNKNIAFKDGAATRAAEGFARSKGLGVNDIFFVKKGEQEFIAVKKVVLGKTLKELLADNLSELIGQIHFPKSMRWLTDNTRFARPIRWMLALLNDEIVPFSYGNVSSADITFGHRILAKESPVKIDKADWELYLSRLEENGVVADNERRKKMIEKLIIEKQQQFFPEFSAEDIDQELLEEVNFICEYPCIGMGSFDEKFLEVPEEVLITSMAHHQKYFPVFDADRKLKNHFLFIFNNIADHEATISKGNEKVLRARLEDAHFFYQEDLKDPFDSRLEMLDRMVYQKQLGSYLEKSKRVSVIAQMIAEKLGKSVDELDKAAMLSKADLTTHMVYELPELQGIMGRIYLKAQGSSDALAQAMEEHYAPRFSNDELPASDLGMILALADRLDTLIGLFGIGQKPSGSKDPYGLRRSAIGVCRILLEKELDLDLKVVFENAVASFTQLTVEKEQLSDTFLSFLNQRAKVFLTSECAYQQDLVEAVFLEGHMNFFQNSLKLKALVEIAAQDDFQDLTATFKRVANIIRQASSKMPDWKVGSVDTALFEEDVEKCLFSAASKLSSEANQADAYLERLKSVSALRPLVDEYFDKIMVMAKDEKVKINRLNTLAMIESFLSDIADFTLIQGSANA